LAKHAKFGAEKTFGGIWGKIYILSTLTNTFWHFSARYLQARMAKRHEDDSLVTSYVFHQQDQSV